MTQITPLRTLAFRRDNEKFGRRRVITDLKVKGVHAGRDRKSS